ncbi:hypothetical protein SKAU_G00317130 [Synaphobranchus kaupii]|uniref:Uncharacterized protein n=1 Tax=Synaphobranchus kaupii TaxID=118154 RepID=A0A9Q1ET19_SYNKA|nr:hypothetical protein SKAU_G00317130 [Synaphobranchus kaupii]
MIHSHAGKDKGMYGNQPAPAPPLLRSAAILLKGAVPYPNKPNSTAVKCTGQRDSDAGSPGKSRAELPCYGLTSARRAANRCISRGGAHGQKIRKACWDEIIGYIMRPSAAGLLTDLGSEGRAGAVGDIPAQAPTRPVDAPQLNEPAGRCTESAYTEARISVLARPDHKDAKPDRRQ